MIVETPFPVDQEILFRLAKVLEDRKNADPENSYVAKLYSKGLDSILKKIGEEATETILAAKGEDLQALTHEVADLWFHTLVLLSFRGLGPQDVLLELSKRFGISGKLKNAN